MPVLTTQAATCTDTMLRIDSKRRARAEVSAIIGERLCAGLGRIFTRPELEVIELARRRDQAVDRGGSTPVDNFGAKWLAKSSRSGHARGEGRARPPREARRRALLEAGLRERDRRSELDGRKASSIVFGTTLQPDCQPLADLAGRVVLAATDFTEAGERAVAQALGVVCERGSVHLAHVIAVPAATEAEVREAREQAWYSLSRLASTEDGSRPGRLERHVLEGWPAEQLLALADRIGADLVVLGARSHSVVTRALLGSVAQTVSERAKMPVLLVPGSSSGP